MTKRIKATKIGYAIVVKNHEFQRGLCYTSTPYSIGEGSVYQIYTTENEAREFLNIHFSDAEYEIIPVDIAPVEFIRKV